MKNHLKFLLSVFTLAVVLASCSVYHPNLAMPTMIEEEGETNILASARTIGYAGI